MIFITITDLRGGLQFNHRRQSRDRLLYEDILRRCAGRRLLMHPDSFPLFEKLPGSEMIETDIDFMDHAGLGDCCFAETGDTLSHLPRMEQIILYRWNRVYPADRFTDLPLTCGPLRRISTEDFPGFSHETITVEVYIHEV